MNFIVKLDYELALKLGCQHAKIEVVYHNCFFIHGITKGEAVLMVWPVAGKKLDA